MKITGGTTVTAATTGSASPAIAVSSGDFIMSEGTPQPIRLRRFFSWNLVQKGNISISGTAEVKTTPNVKGAGLRAENIDISGNAKVNVQSTEDNAFFASGKIRIAGGTVTAKGTGSCGCPDRLYKRY